MLQHASSQQMSFTMNMMKGLCILGRYCAVACSCIWFCKELVHISSEDTHI